ncbi:signal peptidase I [Zymomonas mobilis]|uniref:signal peptidase I n=1 Tax=Zymomonas mobilis TaxID=542 RepID=UPI00026D8743|nr:signal peptidase I [Zymomonas mobilis]AFN57273.1 signal peptidase I [Zymomonas mobilis subsp. mobilis ATCC 29191]TQK78964.1 signal peptidase I [Zymomonas mobilis]TQL14826.1 signal peptidase I [Zymomonas mobilis]GEB87300.1 signal peptidase I [Zymomonas mobilis subsp. mobilis]
MNQDKSLDSDDMTQSQEDMPKKFSLWHEIKGIFYILLLVGIVQSFIVKPFYIPSESMMPTLLNGDRLVVSKYPYGWSYASPIFHFLPFFHGRLFGHMPKRGDVVIVVPRGQKSDYIKRVIGLPGDTLSVENGILIINGKPVKRRMMSPAMIPIDKNMPCENNGYLAMEQVTGQDGRRYCKMPRIEETLPNGVRYETLDLGYIPQADDYGPVTIPEGYVFLMGDNRDQSADSRFPLEEHGLGGPVPIESLGGRAEFITFSLDGSAKTWNPLSWFKSFRSGRSGLNLHPTEAKP